MFRKLINCIPNTLTLLNLLCGTLAIVFAIDPSDKIGNLSSWQMAVMMIGIAAIFDFLDGAAARILNAKSAIGKELDSLSDLVSFGVAPAMMMVIALRSANAGIWSFAPLFLPLMGALRLAKFNLDDSQATVFKGLPIPANAIFWIGVYCAMWRGQLNPPLNLTILSIGLMGILMVSNLRMFSLKFSNFSIRDNFFRYLIIAATIAFVAWLGLAGLAATILLYIAISIVQAIVKIS